MNILRRIVAFLIDFFIIMFVSSFLSTLIFLIFLIFTEQKSELLILSSYILIGYILLLTKDLIFKNASIGKKILRIQILTDNNEMPKKTIIVFRNVLIFLWPISTALLIICNKKIEDFIFKTKVVDTVIPLESQIKVDNSNEKQGLNQKEKPIIETKDIIKTPTKNKNLQTVIISLILYLVAFTYLVIAVDSLDNNLWMLIFIIMLILISTYLIHHFIIAPKNKKKLLIWVAVIITIILIIFTLVTKDPNTLPKTILNEREFNSNNISALKVTVDDSFINIKESDNDKIKVIVYGKKTEFSASYIRNNTLIVTKSTDNILPTYYDGIDIYLPDRLLKALYIQTSYGNIDIDKVNYQLIISTDMGDINIKEINGIGNSVIKSEDGNINVGKINNIYIDAYTKDGNSKIENNNRFAKSKLTIKTGTGNIKVK